MDVIWQSSVSSLTKELHGVNKIIAAYLCYVVLKQVDCTKPNILSHTDSALTLKITLLSYLVTLVVLKQVDCTKPHLLCHTNITALCYLVTLAVLKQVYCTKPDLLSHTNITALCYLVTLAVLKQFDCTKPDLLSHTNITAPCYLVTLVSSAKTSWLRLASITDFHSDALPCPIHSVKFFSIICCRLFYGETTPPIP